MTNTTLFKAPHMKAVWLCWGCVYVFVLWAQTAQHINHLVGDCARKSVVLLITCGWKMLHSASALSKTSIKYKGMNVFIFKSWSRHRKKMEVAKIQWVMIFRFWGKSISVARIKLDLSALQDRFNVVSSELIYPYTVVPALIVLYCTEGSI